MNTRLALLDAVESRMAEVAGLVPSPEDIVGLPRRPELVDVS